jgi:outer membrane protein assembly factor BamB
LLWRQKIGAGWSSFAVDDGRAYTQEQQGDDEQVTCYNIRNGHLLWAHTNHAHFSQWQGGDGPRSTPSVEQGLVYAIGATGILDCLDASSGKRVWSRDVLTENQLPNLIWGISCSPLLVDDLVVVTGGLTNRATVLAYDRATGEPKWQAGTDKASYASPVAATIAGQKVILSVNAASLTIHDRQTGAVLLDYPWTNDHWPKAAQPVVLPGDRVFLSSGYAAGCVLLQLTLGNDGKFAKFELWKNMSLKTQFNSAVARDGFLYGLDDGLLACVEVSTGLRRWKDGRYGAGQILLVDDFILVQSEPGPVYLVAADPNQFIELNHLPALGSKTWNYPTLAGRYLLVRNDQAVSCYQLPVQNTLVPGGNRALRGEAGQP